MDLNLRGHNKKTPPVVDPIPVATIQKPESHQEPEKTVSEKPQKDTKPLNPFEFKIEKKDVSEEPAYEELSKKETIFQGDELNTGLFKDTLKEIVTGRKTIVQFLDEIVGMAFNLKSSDVHIEPAEKKVYLRFRIDGLLRDISSFDKALHDNLVSRIKVAAKLRTDEHFAPQDGKIRFIIDNISLDTRISILPTTKGEKVVMRLLSKSDKNLDLESLGLEGEYLEKVKKSYQKPHGMILATGPTGSGKTTTLYSILSNLNSREKNITTIEDPVEYDIDGVNHIQINPKADLTFANGLKSILRQDPDIVMVGEIRDAETAKIAINAAMTGHLLLSTLHTNDAITTIPRLIDIGIEPFLVASTVNLVIAQRLARKLCQNCKVLHTITKEDLENLTLVRPDIAAILKVGENVYESKGCDECGAIGFKGRIGLYEVLEIKESLRKLIVDKTKTLDDVFAEARKEGLVLIVEDGIQKVRQGLTSISELQRVTAIKE